MSDDTLLGLARTLAAAVAPLSQTLRDPIVFRRVMWRIGWDAPDLPPEYATVADAVDDVVALVDGLEDGVNLVDVLAAVEAIGDLYRALDDLPAVPPGLDPADFSANAARRLAEYLLSEYLRRNRPGTYRLFELLGVISVERMPSGAGRSGVPRTRVAWEALPDTLAHLDRVPADVFGWAGAGFAHAEVQRILLGAALGLGLSGSLDAIGTDYSTAVQAGAAVPPTAAIRDGITVHLAEIRPGGVPQLISIGITDLPAEGNLLPGLLIRPLLPADWTDPVPLRPGWTVELAPGSDVSDEVALLVRPGLVEARYPFSDSGFPAAGLGIVLRYVPTDPIGVLAAAGTCRLELAGLALGLSADPPQTGDDDGLGLRVTGDADLALVVTTAGTDSFLATLFGNAEARVEVPVSFVWSTRTGLDVAAGLGLEVHLPIGLDLGWILVDSIDLALGLELDGTSSGLVASVTSTFSGAIGPVVFSVEQFGVELTASASDGNAGPVDLRFGVRWPTGLGIGVDADGVVTGGGFLSIDRAIGRYAGVAQLSMLGVGLTAVGIVETQLPGDPGGWSFFLSVMADFTPIPLPFGFTLNGVGGFMGLHRTMDPDALALGVREGRIDSLLFPEDPLADASRIIADIGAFFPSEQGQHTFGGMVKIGWGPASLVTAELGIVLSLPDVVIAVVGELSVALPVPQAPLFELHMGVVGVLEVAAATLSVSASIYDSQLVGIPLSGDMATYVSLGAQPYFLFSVGGYADGWTPPAALPGSMRDLSRMAASLDLDDVIEVGIDCYFALTPNTLQFGASVYAVLRFHELGVDFSAEGRFSFDVQFTFTPFALSATMSASVEVKLERTTLLDLRATVHLEGPQPWYGTGTGSFRFLGRDVHIAITVGDPPRSERDATEDLWLLLSAALASPDAWTTPAVSADGATPTEVTLRALDPDVETGLWLAPHGAVEVRQHVLPLDRVIEVYGSAVPLDENRFDVEDAGLDSGTSAPYTVLQEWFAPAQYTELTPAERLSAPNFEELDAGVALTTPGVMVPLAEADLASVVAGHEEAVLEPDEPADWRSPVDVRAIGADVWTSGSPWTVWSSTGSSTAAGGTVRRPAVAMDTAPLSVASTRYTLTDDRDAVPVRAADGGSSYADAIVRRRAGAGLRVVPASATAVGSVAGGSARTSRRHA